MSSSKQPRRCAVIAISLMAGCAAIGDDDPVCAGKCDGVGPQLSVRVVRDGHEITTTRVAIDEQLHVTVSGLRPHSEITVRAETKATARDNLSFQSWARFRVSAAGDVDLARDAPIAGSYATADADAIIWSMVPAPASSRLPSQPLDVSLSVEQDPSRVLVETELTRSPLAEGMRVVQVAEAGLVGLLMLPPGATQRKPLIVVGGSEGRLPSYAAQYANWGHPVLALAYFWPPDPQSPAPAPGGLPTELEDIPLESFANAIAWLKARPDVDASRIGVIGVSRGAELALVLASRFPELGPVVAYAPAAHVWSAASGSGHAWRHHGTPLASVPPGSEDMAWITGPGGAPAAVNLPVFESALAAASPDELAAAAIRVENIQGAVLLLAGVEDQIWPACDFAQLDMQRLAASGHADRYADEVVCYPAAGHSLETVGLPTTEAMWTFHPAFQAWLALGGGAEGIARAQRDVTMRVRAFLAQQL